MMDNMEYISINKIEDFMFHDTVVTLKEHAGGNVSFYVDNLVIHKESELCLDTGYDMELGRAVIDLEKATLLTINTDTPIGTYENHVFKELPQEEKIRIDWDKLISMLKRGLVVTDVWAKKGKLGVHFDSDEFFIGFSVEILYDRIVIKWNTFGDKAWYEV